MLLDCSVTLRTTPGESYEHRKPRTRHGLLVITISCGACLAVCWSALNTTITAASAGIEPGRIVICIVSPRTFATLRQISRIAHGSSDGSPRHEVARRNGRRIVGLNQWRLE